MQTMDAVRATFGTWQRLLEQVGWRGLLVRLAGQVAKWALLIALSLWILFPFYTVFVTALKAEGPELAQPFALPQVWHWENLSKAWEVGRFGSYFKNSVIFTISTVIGVLALSSLAGFAFAKLDFRGRDVLFYVFLLGFTIPFQAIMIPLYYQINNLGLIGTYWGGILPMIALGLPFSIFFMRAFFRGLPGELMDAAKIDGCSDFAAFWRVMLPLTTPALTALGVFQFMWSWNAFLLPLIFMQREEIRPLTVGLMFFGSRQYIKYTLYSSGALISMVPVIIVYLIFQRQLIRGLTAGAVKG